MRDEFDSRFVAARRRYIAACFSGLNDMQREAVLTTEGPLLLLAGAGSGKTTVLIRRIANLIRFGCASDSREVPPYINETDVTFLEGLPEDLTTITDQERARADSLCALRPAAPWSVIAITFTNKAAGELKARLAESVGAGAEDVWAMTFHSACCRILRREIDRLGYSKSFTIYDTADTERIIKDIVKSMGLDEKTFVPKVILNMISRAKDKMLDAEGYRAANKNGGDYRLEKIADIYDAYQRRLRANNAVDFDDIILLTVRLLEDYPEVREYYQRKFHYVLIDEYQDTNLMQYRLAELLAGRYENICVVGDDDQSIYRFRGATIENILSFESQYKGARTIRLEQNYRSTQHILDAANAVIANNRGRKGKRLWTANGAGQPVLVYEAFSETEEANFVAGKILAKCREGGFRAHAVLYRTNAQSNALEYSFKRNGIPYRIIGGTRFFDRAEVKDMLAYLCLINNHNDDLRLRRIVNTPARGISGKTLEVIDRLAEAEGKHLYEIMDDVSGYNPLERVAGKVRAFTGLIDGCVRLLEDGMALDQFYEELLERTGYAKMLIDKPTEENQTRLENVRELKSSILSYMENAPEPTLAGFLEEIALYTDIEQYDPNADAVVMMTMHSAKGLEFPNVYLVGLEEGLFPGQRAIGDPEEMEEERRLCYVAITRAKEQLVISHARQRMLYGRTNSCMASRFLREIPEENTERRGMNQTRKEPARASAGAAGGGYARGQGYASDMLRRREHYRQAERSDFAAKSTAQTIIDFNQGDMVQHTAFGRGMVLSVLKMGGDALLEIAFDEIGTKKLMAKTASALMKKL